MNRITALLREFARADDGASASEYAILVAFVATVVALAADQFTLGTIFVTIVAKMQTLVNGV